MNGWERVPDTLRCRIRVENYLRGLGRRVSYTTILRVARIMELRGVRVGHPLRGGIGDSLGPNLYNELRRLHPDLVDLNNEVLHVLRMRAARREREPAPSMTLDDYLAGKPVPQRPI